MMISRRSVSVKANDESEKDSESADESSKSEDLELPEWVYALGGLVGWGVFLGKKLKK